MVGNTHLRVGPEQGPISCPEAPSPQDCIDPPSLSQSLESKQLFCGSEDAGPPSSSVGTRETSKLHTHTFCTDVAPSYDLRLAECVQLEAWQLPLSHRLDCISLAVCRSGLLS